jgi:riboflavin kinase/FMN adenylyltransferase
MEDVTQMLGFPYPVRGTVLHGKKLGRTLGIPTTNLIPEEEKLLPPYGVYVSRIVIDGAIYGGVTNIGSKPTVSNELIRGVETFVFDFSGDLYGKNIEVQLLAFERPELKFESIAQLKEEMDKDIANAKNYLEK